MKTASLKPDSVSIVNITPEAPMSERTICCTPADRAHRVVVEIVVDAVGDGPVVIERREHLFDGLHDGVGATNVEESFLLARERRVGQVLRRRAGSDRERQLLVTPGELCVPSTNLSLEIRWEWLGDHRRTDAATHDGQAHDVVDVEVSELHGA